MDVSEEINLQLNFKNPLVILKLLMVLDSLLNNIFYYILAIILIFNLELHKKHINRSSFAMSYEIVYYYLFNDYFTNANLGGFHLPLYY